jgi:hypothetical protein
MEHKMNYPTFFDNAPTITLIDPLSDFLGTFENGTVQFTYLDIVKSAGHSCPTVSGAYLTTVKALEALYNDGSKPVRGNIFVSFKSNALEGVAGVIANVVGQITGATENSGFKGLNGKFARNNLMEFDASIGTEVTFKRLDTGKTVAVTYNPSSVGGNPKMQELMGKLMQGQATPEEKKEFGKLWQSRVEAIFKAADEVITVKEI